MLKILLVLFSFNVIANCDSDFDICSKVRKGDDARCIEYRYTCEMYPRYLEEREDEELNYIMRQSDIDYKRRNK